MTRSLPEPLEPRIAPAGVTIVGNTATWIDYDGDHVIMTWTGSPLSKGIHGLKHDTPPVFDYFTPINSVNGGIIVSEITLSNPNDHIQISVKTDTRGRLGNGHVDIGYINATGLPLASFIAKQTSVLEFDCGNGTTLQAGNAIVTLDLAGYGTQNPEVFNINAAPTLPAGADGIGQLLGKVGTVAIAGNLEYGELVVGLSNSTVGSVTIGGNLLGDALIGSNSGFLNVAGKTVTSITIGKSVIGGPNPNITSGVLQASGSIGSITIGGDVIGGNVQGSGALNLDGDIPASVATLNINGSVLGGSGPSTGYVDVRTARIFNIKGNLVGGSTDQTGFVEIGRAMNVDIFGSIIGGVVTDSNTDLCSGLLHLTGNVTNVAVGHNLVTGTDTGGGSVKFDGAIAADGQLSRLSIAGDIIGSNAQRAYILVQGATHSNPGAFNALGLLNVTGDVRYAVIEAGQAFGPTTGIAEQPNAGIGQINIGGNYLHTSLMAGINDNPYSTAAPDGVDGSDSTFGSGTLGPIVIKGAILDDSASAGFSGFEANIIQSITVDGIRVFTTGHAAPVLDPLGFVLIYEVGQST